MIRLKIRYADNLAELSFPCTEQALQDAITAIRADLIVGPAELYVAEVIYPEELGFLQDRFANLDEVNYLAKRMDSFFGDLLSLRRSDMTDIKKCLSEVLSSSDLIRVSE